MAFSFYLLRFLILIVFKHNQRYIEPIGLSLRYVLPMKICSYFTILFFRHMYSEFFYLLFPLLLYLISLSCYAIYANLNVNFVHILLHWRKSSIFRSRYCIRTTFSIFYNFYWKSFFAFVAVFGLDSLPFCDLILWTYTDLDILNYFFFSCYWYIFNDYRDIRQH